jgi:hypothetical protein
MVLMRREESKRIAVDSKEFAALPIQRESSAADDGTPMLEIKNRSNLLVFSTDLYS